MSLDKKTFLDLLKQGSTKAPKKGKIDWDEILTAIRKDGGVYTTTDIWELFVEMKVNRYRTKEVLHKWAEEGKIARIYNGQYYWTADPKILKAIGK